MDNQSSSPPTRNELAWMSLFAATEEERKIAKRLLRVTPESKDDIHPLLLSLRDAPLGSEAAKIASETPSGRIIQEILDAQPSEDYAEEYSVMFDEVIKVRPKAEGHDNIIKQPEPEEHTLESRLKQIAIQRSIELAEGEAKPKPRMVVAKPIGESREMRPLSSDDPLY